MLERAVTRALRAGLSALANADSIHVVPYLSRQLDFNAVEAEKALVVLQGMDFGAGATPSIRLGHPRGEAPFPAILVALAEEHETDRFGADYGGDLTAAQSIALYGDDSMEGAETHASFFQTDIWATIEAEGAAGPDVASYVFDLARFVLLKARSKLVGTLGLIDYTLRGGELAPDPRYLPANLTRRRLVVSAKKEIRIVVAVPPAPKDLVFPSDILDLGDGWVRMIVP